MIRNRIPLFLVLLAASPSFAQGVERTDPVNSAKLSLGLKVQVPEGIGMSVGIDAPVTRYLSLGGEVSSNFNLPQSGDTFKPVLRVSVTAKPRLVYNDRFETYLKAQIGPAFQFVTGGMNLGVDVSLLPGFQFSMTESVGMFSELGFGLTYYPRTQENSYAGIFRSGVFFAF